MGTFPSLRIVSAEWVPVIRAECVRNPATRIDVPDLNPQIGDREPG